MLKRFLSIQEKTVQYLRPVKVLPMEGQTDGPNDERTNRVQHHASRSRQLFRHTHTGKVEERDADHSS